ncbi:MAG: hypothetical protein M0011_01365 [Elusimicrobia bacterium]|nr:hypothetical protein [Elusimicrobiota bacterium]
MKKTLFFAVLLAAAPAAYCAQSEVKTFPAAGLKKIYVDTGAGSITVDGGAKGEVRAEAIGDDLGKCAITMEVKGSELVLKAEDSEAAKAAKKGFWRSLFSGGKADLGKGCGAGFKVSAPAALSVKADTGAGSISVSGMTGELDADTGAGSISGSGCLAALKADTGAGTVRMDGLCGPAEADTGAGSIELSWAKAPSSGRVKADAGTGSITLVFPADASLDVKADAGIGKAVNEFGSGGRLKVLADSGVGSISVLKAK